MYKIEFLNAAGIPVSGGLAGVDVFESNQITAATPYDEWTLLGVGTAPAPAGTAFVQAVLVGIQQGDGNGNALGGAIFWDDASLVRLTADYNGNNAVDAADYVAWRKNPDNFYGNPGGFDFWRGQFGRNPAGSGLGSQVVPEPGTMILAIAAALGLFPIRRRQC